MARYSRLRRLLKTHGPLGSARIDVRQSAYVGEGFRETNGSHGIFEKFFQLIKILHAVSGSRRRDAQKVFGNCLCIRAFSQNPFPGMHFRRTSYRALPCDPCDAGHHCPTGKSQTVHRRPTWAFLGRSFRPASARCQRNFSV